MSEKLYSYTVDEVEEKKKKTKKELIDLTYDVLINWETKVTMNLACDYNYGVTSKGCSYCDVFGEWDDCSGCPVSYATGEIGCLDSPWVAISIDRYDTGFLWLEFMFLLNVAYMMGYEKKYVRRINEYIKERRRRK